MNNVSQNEKRTLTRALPSRAAKIPEDCWEALRLDAFQRRISISRALAEILRNHYGLILIPEVAMPAKNNGSNF